MRVDVHTHLWNDQLGRADEYVAGLRSAGIDQACLLPIAPYMDNEAVAEIQERFPDRVIGFASVVPFAETTGIARTDPVGDLGHAVEDLGLRGLKLHPLIQGFDLADPGLVPVVSAAGDMGIPVLVHTGPSNGRAGRIRNGMLEKVDDLAIMCPETTIIAGHANPMGVGVYLARKHPNVYLETSISWPYWEALIPGLPAKVVSEAGPEKVLYGSDFSLGKSERIKEADHALRNLPDSHRDLVMGENARRIFS